MTSHAIPWCNSMALTPREIGLNLAQVRQRIDAAARESGRKASDIRLIAVSKRMTADCVAAAISAGQHCFGENTLQDAKTKQMLIDAPENEWHFIGHLQSNKARVVVTQFDWLHTLDSLKLATRLSDGAHPRAAPLKVLLQVNIANDPDKYGLAPTTLDSFIENLLQSELAGIELQGLMTIGQRTASLDQRRREFTALRELGTQCAAKFGAHHFRELSMGMSDDFETAIAEGATMIRVGSTIFGARPAVD